MRYQFDEFELDADRYELRRSGVAQHVEPLVFDLMVFLAANAGRIVGRDEIVERVWQGRAVSDATISSCIKSARRALGDTGERPGLYPHDSGARLRVHGNGRCRGQWTVAPGCAEPVRDSWSPRPSPRMCQTWTPPILTPTIRLPTTASSSRRHGLFLR